MSTPEYRIAGRIREARKRLGLSQEDAARKLDVSLRTYARWERIESLGFLWRLGAIGEALETSESDLLGGESLQSDDMMMQVLATKLDDVMAELRELRRDLSE